MRICVAVIVQLTRGLVQVANVPAVVVIANLNANVIVQICIALVRLLIVAFLLHASL